MWQIKTTTISILVLGLPAGSAVGVAAQDDLMAPAFVTGVIEREKDESAGTVSFADDTATFEGFRDANRWEASDSRLEGASTYVSNWREYPGSGFSVEVGTHVPENDGGRWGGTSTGLFGRDAAVDTVILHGEGGYEGLTAYVVIDPTSASGGEFDAGIFTGGLPPSPEAPNE